MVLGWGSFAYIPVKLGNKLELGGDPFLRGLVVHVKITTPSTGLTYPLFH